MKTPQRKRVSSATKARVPAVADLAVEPVVSATAEIAAAEPPVPAALVAEPAAPAPQALDSTVVLDLDAPLPAGPGVCLPSNSTVKDAASLQAALLNVVESTATVALDARSVERIDTATMQLLCAFVRERTARNLGVQWLGSPAVIVESAGLLGMQSMLALPPAGAT